MGVRLSGLLVICLVFSSVSGGALPSRDRWGPVLVVVVSPVFGDDSDFEELGEVFDLEAFVA